MTAHRLAVLTAKTAKSITNDVLAKGPYWTDAPRDPGWTSRAIELPKGGNEAGAVLIALVQRQSRQPTRQRMSRR